MKPNIFFAFALAAVLLSAASAGHAKRSKHYTVTKGTQTVTAPAETGTGAGPKERDAGPAAAKPAAKGAGIGGKSGDDAGNKGGTSKSRSSSKSDFRPALSTDKRPAGCQYYGLNACGECLMFWASTGNGMNNHFCKDKSRANGTKGWDCFNYVEDTSHGYVCISYCPPGTPTCKDHCDQRHADGSAYHDHPLRRTQNVNNGRIMGPPGSAPKANQGLEERDKCNW